MRLIGSVIFFVLLAVGLNACFDPPQFGPVPSLDYSKISFIDVTDPSKDDSLILLLNFKDGDGDLGLDNQDNNPAFTNKYYFFESNGQRGYLPAGGTISNPPGANHLVSYKSKRIDSRYDTLPPYVSPYICLNWEIISDQKTGKVTDTLYFQLNPNTYNIFVDFYVQQNDGSFKYFNWAEQFPTSCEVAGYNGRFPVLTNDVSKNSALEGQIRYAMTSAGWNIFFSTKTLKLKVRIQDRSLNKSNTVETPAFNLRDITVH
jgi:hypothetical protein